jgi:4-hydroxy-tetrahydrodipicolinate reductase
MSKIKIALLGAGKTGTEVLNIIKNYPCLEVKTVFNSQNNATLENLKGHDVILSFLTGSVFHDYIDIFIESELPVITGSTGFDWPGDIGQRLKAPWIHATNFSIAMTVVQNMLNELGKISKLNQKFEYGIYEEHHQHKIDGPSGTAQSWKTWLSLNELHEQKVDMSFHREGDIIGYHKAKLENELEMIELSHTTKNRSLFANGALWACQVLMKVKHSNIRSEKKIHLFSDIVNQFLNEV